MRKSALLWFGLIVVLLSVAGLLLLATASGQRAYRLYADQYFFLKRQLAYFAAGVAVATVAAMIDYRWWRDHAFLVWTLAVGVLVLLGLVFLFRPINGSHRWLAFGPLRLQPSEFAKFTVVIFLAAWLDRLGYKVELFKQGALLPAVFLGVMELPILLEPDFGSFMVVGLTGALVMFVAGVRLLHMLPFAGLAIAVFVVKVATNANRMARIAAFVGIKLPGANVTDAAAERAAHQANQALAAIGNSHIWGVGLGQSMQKQDYLPEAHTDFIFAIGSEELGILFSLGVVLAFCLFFAFSVYIARKASDRFGRFLVVGLAFIIFFQAMFNVGVVCKALPTKGMALPFFSYGGTNLLATFFCVGTILSVGIHSYRDRRRAFVNKVVVHRSNGKSR